MDVRDKYYAFIIYVTLDDDMRNEIKLLGYTVKQVAFRWFYGI
jgi:hypothetical protein